MLRNYIFSFRHHRIPICFTVLRMTLINFRAWSYFLLQLLFLNKNKGANCSVRDWQLFLSEKLCFDLIFLVFSFFKYGQCFTLLETMKCLISSLCNYWKKSLSITFWIWWVGFVYCEMCIKLFIRYFIIIFYISDMTLLGQERE